MRETELSITEKQDLRLDRVAEIKPGNVEDDLHIVHVLTFFSIQLVFILFFALFTEYSDSAEVNVLSDLEYYPLYQDVHVMIFIGFGFLYTFMHQYSFSAISFSLLIGCVAIQWSILVNGFFHNVHTGVWERIQLNIRTMIESDFAAGVCLVSFGVLLGKVSAMQTILLVLIEVPIYSLNRMIGSEKLQAVDMGGSMFIHTFGAFFGLGIAYINRSPFERDLPHLLSDKVSELFSMLGSLFLFLFWPSFNSALALSSQRQRVVINTVLSLCSSMVCAMVTSKTLRPYKKFEMVDMQFAILAGGVAIGTSANLNIGPGAAIGIGFLAGVLCVFGFVYGQPFVEEQLGMHDTVGVQILHGGAGVLGGIAGAIAAAAASDSDDVFPARADGGRSASGQAGMQMAALGLSIGLGVFGGVLSGVITHLRLWAVPLTTEEMFNDKYEFMVPEENASFQVGELSPLEARLNCRVSSPTL